MRLFTRLVILAAYCIVLSGCFTRCYQEELYKHKVISKGSVSTSIQSDGSSYIEIGKWATIKISGSSALTENRSGVAKLEIRLEDQHTFQFKEAEIRVTMGNIQHSLSMGKVKYEIFTKINQDGSKESDSSITLPTDSKIEHFTYGDNGYAQTDYYSFDASSKFRGSYTNFAPAFELAISKIARRRPYLISFEIPLDTRNNFILAFPNVLVDDIEYQLPSIEFESSKISKCYNFV